MVQNLGGPGFVIQHPDSYATWRFKYEKVYRLNAYLDFPKNFQDHILERSSLLLADLTSKK